MNNNKLVKQVEEEQQENINKIHPFTDKWEKEKALFDKAIMRGLYSDSGKRLKEERKFPRFKSTEEIVYERFMAKVSNVSNGEFYPQKDSDGNRIPQKDGIANCNYYIETIIRIKTVSGEEFLYSMGNLEGWDASGLPVECFLAKPEVWTRTIFSRERIYDDNTKQFFETTRGPTSSYEEYDLPYSPSNVQMLYDKRDKSTKNAKPISFIVKDEQSGMDVSVRGKTNEESFNLIRNHEFDYLFNVEYRTKQDLEKDKAEKEAKYGGKENNQPYS